MSTKDSLKRHDKNLHPELFSPDGSYLFPPYQPVVVPRLPHPTLQLSPPRSRCLPAHIPQASKRPCPTELDPPLPIARIYVDEPVSKRQRVEWSAKMPAVPKYRVPLTTKSSKKVRPQQIKGIGWLTENARSAFVKLQTSLLARWGIKWRWGYRGPCVLVPAAWGSLDPERIMEIQTCKKFPVSGKSRLKYCFEDLQVSHGRALAWFSKWPRTGVELDNFLGAGPFKLHDGGHPCHQDYCIAHCDYVTVEHNHDCQQCRTEAISLRKDRLEVPEECTLHQPPCWLQHASLSSIEAIYIQFSNLRTAKRLPAPAPPTRPAWHTRAPTFEYQLPLQFCPQSCITLAAEDFVMGSPRTQALGHQEIICKFCETISSFNHITSYWGHLLKLHDGIGNSERLAEVKRSAACWTATHEREIGGKKSVAWRKIERIECDDFSWEEAQKLLLPLVSVDGGVECATGDQCITGNMATAEARLK